MEPFLASLSPALRAEVQRALEQPDGKIRLTAVVGRYIGDDGTWPDDPITNDALARQFVAQSAGFVGAAYGGAGLASTTVAGLAGGAVALGAGTGAVVISSALMSQYWQQTLAYSTGLNPLYIKAAKKVFDKVSKDTHWEQLAKDLTGPSGPSVFGIAFGDGYAQLLEKELYGIVKRSAWRGARSAAYHMTGHVGDVGQENDWVVAYLRRFARNQVDLAQQTMMRVLNTGLEKGLAEKVLGQRLAQLWNLTPRYAQAVENYRGGMEGSERSKLSIEKLSEAYAGRLRTSRLSTLASTEMFTTFNLGREQQWIQAVQRGEMPLNTVKMWVTAQDELVCKVCRPLDGATAPLGEVFEGTNFLVPTAHPNCRCLLVPVTSTADFSRSKKLVFPKQKVSKHLGGSDGKQDHPSGTPQSVHAGGKQKEREVLWDLTTRALSRGEVTSRSELTTTMRKKNRDASRSLRGMRNGKITEFSTKNLGVMTEGVGFRLGNQNHIRSFANRMMAGEDLFRFRGRRDPIMVLVYDDGAQVLDGKHRLAAAQMVGLKEVPVQIARIRKPMPEPQTFRQEWDELRRNLVRYQNTHGELPKKRPDEPFDVRTPYRFEIAFNEWMQTQSALRDEARFLEHGVERGTKPRRFRRG